MSKAVLPSSKQMHQCVSVAHLGSCSPGCTGLGSSVRVRLVLMRRVRVALVSSDFMRPQSVAGRLLLQQTPADRLTVVTSSIVGLKVNVITYHWPESISSGRSNQGVSKYVHVHLARASPSACTLTYLQLRNRAFSSLCRWTNQRAQNKRVYWSISVQSPPTSSAFHVITDLSHKLPSWVTYDT